MLKLWSFLENNAIFLNLYIYLGSETITYLLNLNAQELRNIFTVMTLLICICFRTVHYSLPNLHDYDDME